MKGTKSDPMSDLSTLVTDHFYRTCICGCVDYVVSGKSFLVTYFFNLGWSLSMWSTCMKLDPNYLLPTSELRCVPSDIMVEERSSAPHFIGE